jgi:ABC-type Zn uptake system ZnuABC Zn-binding protein ZnuA
MVENILGALTVADADNAAFYAENARSYVAQLAALDERIRSQVAIVPPACRKLVTNHEVLGYYASAYGFELIGSVIPTTASDAQPSAADVAAVVRRIRAEGVPAIFAETSGNAALVRQVGREAGIKVVDDLYGDSLGAKSSDGETYVKMMESNTRKIVEALRDCRA